MKGKFFSHIIVNVVLVALVLCISAVSLFGSAVNVFHGQDYYPVYRGQSSDKVCLMINVYWGTEYLDGFLEIFEKYGVKATFFVGGVWVAENPQYVIKIHDAGHELGNHGFYHKMQSQLSYDGNVDEIVNCSKLVFSVCGVFPTLFAPPGGDFNDDTLKAAYDNGMKTVLWSRDTVDWRDKDSSLVYTRATKETEGGELILMHPTAHTLRVLEDIVKYYLDKNIQPVTVGEMLGV